MSSSGVLTYDLLKNFRSLFYEDSRNILAQNICTKSNPIEACASRKVIQESQHAFTHKIETEGKPITNQKMTGRCWIFATLNVIRVAFMKHHDLEDFEFSQAYLFFWDKVERCNFFLHNIVKSAKANEPVDGRLLMHLLSHPLEDGGQWDMIVNLISKHGLMPKACFPESYNSESSARMNCILESKLREYSKILRGLISKGNSDEEIEDEITKQMAVIYRIIGICLGVPPEKFTWEYNNKSNVYNSIGPVTPLEFYEKYVQPHYNVNDKFCLVTDPRPSNSYGQLYTIDYLGNVVGGRLTLYNNQPVERIINLVAESIKNNEPVWFGCDMNKRLIDKAGIHDLRNYDFKLMFGTDVHLSLDKADRMIYGDSKMVHAMAFTAVSIDENGDVTKLRVENSWGEEHGEKGYYVETVQWFKEFVFEIVLDKKYIPEDMMAVFDQKPIVLPAWDPMGVLAHC